MAFDTVPLISTNQFDEDPNSWEKQRMFAESGIGETLKAAAQDAWYYSPTSSIIRQGELNDAENGSSSLAMMDIMNVGNEPTNKPTKMTQDEWKNSPHFRDGLKFDDGVNENVARILAERFDQRQERNRILSNSPRGFFMGAGIIGTEFIVSSLDPINLAVGMIPIIGQAKLAANVGKAARVASRFKSGAITAGVGTALTEPIVYLASERDQADYGANDVMLSIAFGATLGGLLNVGAGAFKDFRAGKTANVEGGNVPNRDKKTSSPIKNISDGDHLAALRIAISQMADGKPIEVRPMVNAAIHNRSKRTRQNIQPKTFLTVSENGGALVFPTAQKAKRYISHRVKTGFIDKANTTIKKMDDGTFQVQFATKATLHTDVDGNIKIYDTKRLAKKEASNINKATVIPVPKASGKGVSYAIVKNANEKDVGLVKEHIARNQYDDKSLSNFNHTKDGSMRDLMDIKQQSPDELNIEFRKQIAENVKSREALDAPAITESVDVKPVQKNYDDISVLEKEVADLEQEISIVSKLSDSALDNEFGKELADIESALKKIDDYDEAVDVAVMCLRTR